MLTSGAILYLMSEIEKYQFIHHFVPHPVHRKRATLLSHKALFAYSLILLVLLFAVKVAIPKVFPGVLGYASNITVSDLYASTNKLRADNGLSALALNETLSAAARQKAEDMFKNDYWAHISPSGVKPWDFIIGANYDYSYAGENLAKNFNTSDEVVSAWNNSPSHRENLLSSNYDDVGYAVVDGVLGGYKTTLVVQMFGRPRTPSYLAGTESGTPVGGPSVSEEAVKSESTQQAEVGAQELVPQEAIPVVETEQPPVPAVISVQPTPQQLENPIFPINLALASKYMLAVFGFFILGLMVLDVWYSRRKAIPKFTGHTFAHITLLLFLVASIWLVMSPGSIL